MRKSLLALLIVFLFGCSSAMAQVIGWRTGDSSGRFLDAAPPTEWTAETNTVWKTALPAPGNASPVIVGDRIFICAEPTTLICVNANNGEILWQKTNTYLDMLGPEERAEVQQKLDEVDLENTTKEFRSAKSKLDKAKNKLKKLPEASKPEEKTELERQIKEVGEKLTLLEAKLKPVEKYIIPQTHDTNGYSSPTPASDGENVYVLFGTGTAACYDMDGNRKWIKVIEKPTHNWGLSASPLVLDDKLIVHIRNIFALDKNTGEVIWKNKASKDDVRWGTATIAKIGGVDVIITPNGDFFRASDGKLMAENISVLDYARPIVYEGVVYFIQHGGKAFKLPSEAGDAIEPEFLWETKPKKDRYYASSVLHEGLIYAIVRQGHFFSVIDAETGEVVYEKRLKLGKGTTYPSIVLAGDYLFISNDNGTTVAMEPGREPKEIARNSLETFRSSPVFVGKRLYIRGMENMYCIGE